MLIPVATLVTSLTSLFGFFFTTGRAWRKERREQQQTKLDLEMKRLEVEKLRLEVERKKQDSSPATGSSKRYFLTTPSRRFQFHKST